MADIFDRVADSATQKKDIFDYVAEGRKWDADKARIDAETAAVQDRANQPAAMTKEAAPSEPYDPGFINTLFREAGAGISQVRSGLKQTFSLPDEGKNNPASGLLDVAGGVMRTLTSPITAAGSQVGETSGETVRSATEPYLGPTGSAIAGTAIGAPLNAATQLLAAPYALSKIAAPLAMRGVQGIARSLPGAQITLRDIGRKIIEAMPSALKPAVPATDLYDQVKQLNPVVTLSNFSKVAELIAAREGTLNKYGVANTRLESVARKLAESTAASKVHNLPKELPFRHVQAIRQRIGERIGELRVKSGEGLDAYKQLFKALSQELETTANVGAQSANTPAARAAFAKLKEANAAANREFAIGELDDIFNATMGRALEGKEYSSSNFAQALNKIRDLRRSDPLFEKGIGAQNLTKIEKHLDELRQLKITPPPKGATFGSGPSLILGGGASGLAYGIGNAIGGPPLAATLGAISGGTTLLFPPVMSRIIQSEVGSKALLNVLKSEGTVSSQKIGAILSLIKGEESVRNDLAGRVESALKSDSVSLEEKIKAAMNKSAVFRQVSEAQAVLGQ